jgi:3-(3-hydroxy-phenyl)propionate hydroxylase
MAQVALSSSDDRHQALRDTMADLLAMDEPRRRIAGMMSGLDIRYDPRPAPIAGDLHPLVGRRMPDLDIRTSDGPTRVSALLHEARPVLLTFGAGSGVDVTPWSDRVRLVRATHDADDDGDWELPVIGEVAAPPAVLIRPDGYVAWVGAPDDPLLLSSLTEWFGARPVAVRQ